MSRLAPEAEAALRRGKRQILDIHGSDPNVTGAGVGFRVRDGKMTDEPVVTVLVAKKRPEPLVSKSRLLPKTVQVDGKQWGVDVVQAGPFRLHTVTADAQIGERKAAFIKDATDALTLAPESFKQLTGKVRPPLQGCSISNFEDGKVAGTLGCFVTDLTTGDVCLLSANHVIARLDAGKPGQDILQPGGLDEKGGPTKADRIAGLTRWAPLIDGTEVDGAIAKLDNQTPGKGYSTAVMDGLMAPISDTHPTVGMVVAGDIINTFLTRMDATLAALNVLPLGAQGEPGANSEVIAPEIFMNLEKVGRTTGYTSATIMGIGFDIKVDTGHGVITYNDTIWTLFFTLPGDSGSVACAGGKGNLLQVLAFLALLACELLDALETYYKIPLNTTANSTLATDLRDNFLSQSLTGQLLIDLTYANATTVVDRLKQDTGPAHHQSIQQAHAQALYKKYHALAARLITSKSPKDTVKKSQIAVVSSILAGLAQCGMFTSKELAAGSALLKDVLQPTVGMNRAKLLAYMNKHSVFLKVYDQVSKVPTVKLTGPIKTE